MGMIFMVDSVCIIENNIANTEGVEIDSLWATCSEVTDQPAASIITAHLRERKHIS